MPLSILDLSRLASPATPDPFWAVLTTGQVVVIDCTASVPGNRVYEKLVVIRCDWYGSTVMSSGNLVKTARGYTVGRRCASETSIAPVDIGSVPFSFPDIGPVPFSFPPDIKLPRY